MGNERKRIEEEKNHLKKEQRKENLLEEIK